jgi:hypothetical protein
MTGFTNDKSFQSKLSERVTVPNEPISTGINITLHEDIFKRSCRILFIHCNTEEIYPSAGYKIKSNFVVQDSILNIDFINIEAPETGPAINAPALAIFEISSFDFDNLILKITINGKMILGQIICSDASYKIQIQPNNIIEVKNPTILRVPVNIIWGQAESISPEPYKVFLDSLEYLGAKQYNLQPGEYNYFQIKSDGSFQISSNFGMEYGEKYIFEFGEDTLITRNLIKRFAKRYKDNIYIKLSGGHGEQFFSTVLKNE